MNILITICGRKGSKGVKNKNIMNFCGYPLFMYTLSAADLFRKGRANDCVHIAVNSDSMELMEMAKKTGLCETVNRSPEMASDSSAKIPVIQYSTSVMEERNNKTYDYIIDLDITAPIRTIEDIHASLQILIEDESFDLVFSVVPARRNPYFNMVRTAGDHVEKVFKSDLLTRQEAPVIYDMNASIYVYRRHSLVHTFEKSPFDGRCGISIMKYTNVLDIDSQEDFEFMELLYLHYFSKLESYKIIQDHIQNEIKLAM